MSAEREQLEQLLDRFVLGLTSPQEEQSLASNAPELTEQARELRELRDSLLALPPDERLGRLLRERPEILERIADHGPTPETLLTPAEALKRARERSVDQAQQRDREQDRGPQN